MRENNEVYIRQKKKMTGGDWIYFHRKNFKTHLLSFCFFLQLEIV